MARIGNYGWKLVAAMKKLQTDIKDTLIGDYTNTSLETTMTMRFSLKTSVELSTKNENRFTQRTRIKKDARATRQENPQLCRRLFLTGQARTFHLWRFQGLLAQYLGDFMIWGGRGWKLEVWKFREELSQVQPDWDRVPLQQNLTDPILNHTNNVKTLGYLLCKW